MIWLLLPGLLGGCTANKVQVLSLQDDRLPVEARRWLADAEDELAIARARLDDAEKALERNKDYRKALETRVDALENPGLSLTFAAVSNARVQLESLTVKAARARLAHAKARLSLTRAETASRHDLAVYDLTPMIAETDRLREVVASAEKDVEEQRAALDAATDTAWKAYAEHVQGGGKSEALFTPEVER